MGFLRRLLVMIPLLIGITFIVFVVMNLAPGDPFAELRMNPSFSPDTIAALEREFGFGQPVLVRYGKWLWQAAHLDLGPVDRLSRAGHAADRNAGAEHADPGRGQHRRQLDAGRSDRHLRGAAAAARSPTACSPSSPFSACRCRTSSSRSCSCTWRCARDGFRSAAPSSLGYDALGPAAQLLDRLHHLVLPVVVLGTSGMASLMRLMRGQILAIRDADFVRTARAKGVPERRVVWKHILRNALNPFVTLAGYELGTLLSGAALVEAVMNLQGLGTLLLEAVRSLDVFLVLGSVLMGSDAPAARQPARRSSRSPRSTHASTSPAWRPPDEPARLAARRRAGDRRLCAHC